MLLIELVDPAEKEDVIKRSFGNRIVPDLLADEAHKGELIPSAKVIEALRKKFPILRKMNIEISEDADRVRIYFDDEGNGKKVVVPPQMKQGLGEILVLHEIAHMLYTKDILTNKILKHRAAPEAFTILRVLEDIAIEEKLEKEHPESIEVFKKRGQHIMPIYKKHVPTEFANKVDQLFLKLRGYSSKEYDDPYALRYAREYLDTDDIEKKTNAIFHIVSRFTGKG